MVKSFIHSFFIALVLDRVSGSLESIPGDFGNETAYKADSTNLFITRFNGCV